MSNRRETTEDRILRRGRNSLAILEAYADLETEGVTLNGIDQRKRYRALKTHQKARRLLSDLRGRQLASFQANTATAADDKETAHA